jgi:hypothetical protein
MDALVELADGRVATREKIVDLQQAMRDSGQEPLVPQIRHYFAPGLYARECFVPAGACVVGKIHLFDCLNVVLGDIIVYSPGETGKRITGCETFASKAGAKRAVFAYTDTWWTTFHPNPDNERDIPTLEARYVVDDFEALDHALAERALLGASA